MKTRWLDYDDLIDHTNRLGFTKMPTGYKLYQLVDSGHFFWHNESTDEESCISWNKWQVYKWAKFESEERK